MSRLVCVHIVLGSPPPPHTQPKLERAEVGAVGRPPVDGAEGDQTSVEQLAPEGGRCSHAQCEAELRLAQTTPDAVHSQRAYRSNLRTTAGRLRGMVTVRLSSSNQWERRDRGSAVVCLEDIR